MPFVMNSQQLKLHAACEDQIKRKGWVRKIVLKARQMGISSYVAGRFYHKTTMNKYVNTWIMAHDFDSSAHLFGLADTFQKNNPLPPHIGTSNIKELVFDKLDSSYFVGTAGAKATGRGRTITLYHASEAAMWPNAAEHFAASIQAVPLERGTEIILESTANGPSGEFYERWQDAVRGVGDYEPVFLPWYQAVEYVRPDLVTPDFALSTERADDEDMSEAEYAAAYNLSHAQVAWRRAKIAELRGIPFAQEYPAYAEEAFVAKTKDAYIPTRLIVRARHNQDKKGEGPLIMGIDPAGEGGDRFAVALRRGYAVEQVIWRSKAPAVEAAQWVHSLVVKHKPDIMFIDSGGIGKSIISILRSYGDEFAPTRLKPVNFGAKSQFKMANPKGAGPTNRRAEMYMRFKEWLELEEGVSIPDMNDIQGDLGHVKVKPSLTNDLTLMSKQEIKSKPGGRSPDLADAIVLTFADLRIVPHNKHKSDSTPILETMRGGLDIENPQLGGVLGSWMG